MDNGLEVEFVPTQLTPEEVEGEFNLAIRKMEVLHLRSIIDKHYDTCFPGQQMPSAPIWDEAKGEGFMTQIHLLRDDTLAKMRGG